MAETKKQEPSDLELTQEAVKLWLRHNHDDDMTRPSVNVSEVVNVDGQGRFVVLKDHTGGQALPAYPILSVFSWNGTRLVSRPEFMCKGAPQARPGPAS